MSTALREALIRELPDDLGEVVRQVAEVSELAAEALYVASLILDAITENADENDDHPAVTRGEFYDVLEALEAVEALPAEVERLLQAARSGPGTR